MSTNSPRLLVGDLDPDRTVLRQTGSAVHLPGADEQCSHVANDDRGVYREVDAGALYHRDPVCKDCARSELADDLRDEVIA